MFTVFRITSPQLSLAAQVEGVGLVSQLSRPNAVALHALQYVTCNGENCLITLPTYWSLSVGISSFGYAISSIMMSACLVSAIVIWLCRKRVVIRSASVVFLLLMLLGITLLYSAVIAIVQTPTVSSCSAFAWLANLGLQLTFVPLFLKMYRIYKIFSRKQLKILKLTDAKLLCYWGALMMFDIAIMAAWQSMYFHSHA